MDFVTVIRVKALHGWTRQPRGEWLRLFTARSCA